MARKTKIDVPDMTSLTYALSRKWVLTSNLEAQVPVGHEAPTGKDPAFTTCRGKAFQKTQKGLVGCWVVEACAG